MRQQDVRSISGMRLPNIQQIGIPVKDITEAVAYYTKLLNIGHWYCSSTVKHEAVYRGKPIKPEVDIVIAFQVLWRSSLIRSKARKKMFIQT